MNLRRIPLRALAGIAGLALLAGCSGGEGSEAETPSSAETRIVTDSTGVEVKVPTHPENVATLHYAATETLMDLEQPPVGQGAFVEDGVPEGWVDQLNEIPVVATTEPDIEKLAEIGPDLILAPNTFEDDVVTQLQDIAPVYQFTLRGGDRAQWKQRVEEVADAVNESDKLKALDEQFQAEQKRIAEEYADVAKDTTVATVSSFEDSSAYLWGSENMLGTIYDPIGLTWSPAEDKVVSENSKDGESEAQISLELLNKSVSDADIVFVTSDLRGKYDKLHQSLIESPVFEDLPAAKAGNVYPNGKATIAGYSDAQYGLELLEDALKEYSASDS